MKKELKKLIAYLDSTGLNNAEIAKKVGTSAVSISNLRAGQFPSKSIDKFFIAFPDLSPNELFGHYSDSNYKPLELEKSDLEKELEELRKENNHLKTNLNFLKLAINSRLSDEEKKMVNFPKRNLFKHGARMVSFTKFANSLTPEVTQRA
ncbi:MAG: hypothetical protein NXI00_12280 [Cytophagales bacterium]|nr:hypothetical protein [Cytophagales bacterium]